MLHELPFERLLEWEAYDTMEPIGDVRGDWQAASICSIIMNTALARTKSRKRFTAKDMLLQFSEEEREQPQSPQRQSWQEQKMIAMMWHAAFTGKKKKHGR